MKLINKRIELKGRIQIIGILILLSIHTILNSCDNKQRDSDTLTLDLANHPIYSRYNFERNDKFINIGIQPLYLPTGIIFEAIKRDNILVYELSRLNKEIRCFPFLKGADVNVFLQKNLLDGGIGGDMPALSAAAILDLVIPIKLQMGQASIVSAKPMLTNDMRGKRIAYPLGSISHYFVLDLLQDAGISQDQVTLLPMDVSAMAGALAKGEIELFSAWEPIVASAIKENPGLFVTYQNSTSGYLYFRQAFIESHEDVSSYILAAVIRSIKRMKNNRPFLRQACQWNLAAMESLTGQKINLTANELAALAQKDILQYTTLINAIVISDLELQENNRLNIEFEFLQLLNEIPLATAWAGVRSSFDNHLILSILNNPKKYRTDEFNYQTMSGDLDSTVAINY